MSERSLGAYGDDEPTEDELRQLAEAERTAPPPAAEDDGVPLDQDEDGAQKVEDKPPAQEGKLPPAAAPSPEDEARRAFLEKHKDKTPEELAELLYNQSKRASAEGFKARKSAEVVGAVAERLKARKEEIESRRNEFKQKVEKDPDAALLAAKNEQFDRELAEAEEAAAIEVHNAKIDDALSFAAKVIPDFHETIRPTLEFGLAMNYSREELGNITDGRDLATLYLASVTGRLVQAGIIDLRGNLLQSPQAVAETPRDPRLKTPDPVSTLSSSPARSNGAGKTLEQQLADISRMSDEDFAKLDETTLENLLRQAG